RGGPFPPTKPPPPGPRAGAGPVGRNAPSPRPIRLPPPSVRSQVGHRTRAAIRERRRARRLRPSATLQTFPTNQFPAPGPQPIEDRGGTGGCKGCGVHEQGRSPTPVHRVWWKQHTNPVHHFRLVGGRGSSYSRGFRSSTISVTVPFAVRPAPMMVSEAKPVQCPWPSRCSRGSSTARFPFRETRPCSSITPRGSRCPRAGRNPVHHSTASQSQVVSSSQATPVGVSRSNIG